MVRPSLEPQLFQSSCIPEVMSERHLLFCSKLPAERLFSLPPAEVMRGVSFKYMSNSQRLFSALTQTNQTREIFVVTYRVFGLGYIFEWNVQHKAIFRIMWQLKCCWLESELAGNTEARSQKKLWPTFYLSRRWVKYSDEQRKSQQLTDENQGDEKAVMIDYQMIWLK